MQKGAPPYAKKIPSIMLMKKIISLIELQNQIFRHKSQNANKTVVVLMELVLQFYFNHSSTLHAMMQ
jgi:hypothetical protein